MARICICFTSERNFTQGHHLVNDLTNAGKICNSKTYVRDRIFKLSPIHASVINQIP